MYIYHQQLFITAYAIGYTFKEMLNEMIAPHGLAKRHRITQWDSPSLHSALRPTATEARDRDGDQAVG